jgi:hypothetical protein
MELQIEVLIWVHSHCCASWLGPEEQIEQRRQSYQYLYITPPLSMLG